MIMGVNRDKALLVTEDFENNTAVLGEQAGMFVQSISPYFAVSESSVRNLLDDNSVQFVEGMRFFKLNSCTTEQVDDLAGYLNEKMDKLFTAIHSQATSFLSRVGCTTQQILRQALILISDPYSARPQISRAQAVDAAAVRTAITDITALSSIRVITAAIRES